MKRFAPFAVLIAVFLAGSPYRAGAQATPEIELATPQASACTVDPRTAEEIEALVSNIGNASAEVDLATPDLEAATPIPFVAPEGTPLADGPTAAAITDLVTQFYACQNANDTLRSLALMTDDFVVRTIEAGSIDPAAFANPGTPSTDVIASEQQTIALNGIIEVETDVYSVNVVGFDGASGEEFTDYLIVIREGDTYLIDDLQSLS